MFKEFTQQKGKPGLLIGLGTVLFFIFMFLTRGEEKDKAENREHERYKSYCELYCDNADSRECREDFAKWLEEHPEKR